MRRFFWSVDGWPQNFATGCCQGITRCEKVVDLKIESGPGALTLSAAMDSNDAPRDQQFRHYVRLVGNFRSKHLTIKGDGTREVFRPDHVFQFFDTHAPGSWETGSAATESSGFRGGHRSLFSVWRSARSGVCGYRQLSFLCEGAKFCLLPSYFFLSLGGSCDLEDRFDLDGDVSRQAVHPNG
jgi:hypothetical protein